MYQVKLNKEFVFITINEKKIFRKLRMDPFRPLGRILILYFNRNNHGNIWDKAIYFIFNFEIRVEVYMIE